MWSKWQTLVYLHPGLQDMTKKAWKSDGLRGGERRERAESDSS